MAVARQLLKAGLDVAGYRRHGGGDFTDIGGRLLGSPAEVFQSASVVFTCLNDHHALYDVVAGRDGFLTSSASGRIVIDLSTTALEPRFELRKLLDAAGSVLVDCPISGLPTAVEQRQGVFLASCTPDQFAQIEPLLRLLSDEVHYVGDFGSGTKMKYIANFLMAGHVSLAAQAVALAMHGGLDASLAVSVLSAGAGSSFQLASRGPRMAVRDFSNPRATLDSLSDDLVEIAKFADDLHLHSKALDETRELVEEARGLGLSDRDPTALIEAVLARMKR